MREKGMSYMYICICIYVNVCSVYVYILPAAMVAGTPRID